MPAPLPYSVVWADAQTMATLFCIPASSFREHVATGTLPQGVKIGKKRLWRVADVDEALAKLLPDAKHGDDVMDAILGDRNGEKTKARRPAA